MLSVHPSMKHDAVLDIRSLRINSKYTHNMTYVNTANINNVCTEITKQTIKTVHTAPFSIEIQSKT